MLRLHVLVEVGDCQLVRGVPTYRTHSHVPPCRRYVVWCGALTTSGWCRAVWMVLCMNGTLWPPGERRSVFSSPVATLVLHCPLT